MIAALQDTIDRTVRGFLGFCENVAVDVGERSQRPVRPDDIHFGMPSLLRISSLLRVMPASKSAIPSSTRCRSMTSRAKSDHVASSGSSSTSRRASSLIGVGGNLVHSHRHLRRRHLLLSRRPAD